MKWEFEGHGGGEMVYMVFGSFSGKRSLRCVCVYALCL